MNSQGRRVQALVNLDYLLLDNSKDSRDRMNARISVAIDSVGKRMGLKPGQATATCLKEAVEVAEASTFVKDSGMLPDMLVIDQNLTNGQQGASFVKQVVEMGYPAEILLFSQAAQAPQKGGLPQVRYGNLEVAGQGEIDGKIDFMISRLLTKWGDPEYLRGLVLSRAVDVELAMDDCVVSHMKIVKVRTEEFRSRFLGSDGLDAFRKAKLVVSAVPKKKGQTTPNYPSLNEANMTLVFQDIRNKFAHNIVVPDEQSRFAVVLKMKTGATFRYGKKQLQDYFLKCSLMRRDIISLDSVLKPKR
jgi:hypothetical protein